MTFRAKPFAIILLLLAISSGCGSPSTRNTQTPAAKSPSPASTPESSKDGIYKGKGKITKINLGAPSVELDHEDIPGLMPAMLMEFYVTDKSLLNNIKVGDRVDFQLEYKGGMEKIIAVEKAK